MRKDAPSDSTSQIIASAEALRSSAGKKRKRPPRTRQLVRDAERLIGREPSVAASPSTLPRAALLLAGACLVGAAIYLLFVR